MTYRCVIGTVALFLATAALGEEFYRWQDDNGQIHYGQQPPEGVEAKPIKTRTNPSAQRNAQRAAAGGDESATGESSDGAGTVDEEYTKEQCNRARKAVKNLKEGGPDARYTNSNDKIVKYSKKEYNQRLQKNQKFMRRFCTEGKGDGGTEQAGNG